ncbi:FHA domain-containing protein [Marinobacter sediminum]|uniref:FHA domain-containing protein n=1 Tax=Marinobacter sediminum TaxID=256323 RepID=UPI0035658CA0
MARLMLSLDGQVLAEYNMTKERYTIGRLPDNDVRIDNGAVSGHHALVINILDDSFLEDLNSTNGTYVNGKLIKKHALQHGDVITIGHHQLRFADQDAGDSDPDEFEKTMVLRAGRASEHSEEQVSDAVQKAQEAAAASLPEQEISIPHPDSVAPAAPAAAPAAAAAPEPVAAATIPPPAASGGLPRAKLQVISGKFAGKELELTKALTTLGRPGVQVAAVTRRAEGFYVVNVDSGKDGRFPEVNGSPIGPQARRLHDNDVIELAGVKMTFFLI